MITALENTVLYNHYNTTKSGYENSGSYDSLQKVSSRNALPFIPVNKEWGVLSMECHYITLPVVPFVDSYTEMSEYSDCYAQMIYIIN